MTKDEALDFALEELENCADLLKVFEAPLDSCVGAAMLGAEKAITAIKQARSAPVQPVAWMHEWDDGERVPMIRKRDVDSSDIDSPKSVRPLVFGDTTPPAQPAPVPLTDEQILNLAENCTAQYHDLLSFGRAVLAAAQPAPTVQEQIESAKQIWREDQQRIAELSAEIDRLTAAQPAPVQDIEYCTDYHCAGDCGQPHNQKEMQDFLKAQPAPMSQPNRVIAYSAASKLRELGYEWADDAWRQPAPVQDEDLYDLAVKANNGGQP